MILGCLFGREGRTDPVRNHVDALRVDAVGVRDIMPCGLTGDHESRGMRRQMPRADQAMPQSVFFGVRLWEEDEGKIVQGKDHGCMRGGKKVDVWEEPHIGCALKQRVKRGSMGQEDGGIQPSVWDELVDVADVFAVDHAFEMGLRDQLALEGPCRKQRPGVLWRMQHGTKDMECIKAHARWVRVGQMPYVNSDVHRCVLVIP